MGFFCFRNQKKTITLYDVIGRVLKAEMLLAMFVQEMLRDLLIRSSEQLFSAIENLVVVVPQAWPWNVCVCLRNAVLKVTLFTNNTFSKRYIGTRSYIIFAVISKKTRI